MSENVLTLELPQPDLAEMPSTSAEAEIGKKTAALVLGIEAVGLAVDTSLKVASAYFPLLEGLAAREVLAGGGDLAVISRLEGGHSTQEEAEQLSRRQRAAARLGSTALMVGTAYASSRAGIGAAEASGIHSGVQLFGVQMASKMAGLSGMNMLRSRRQQKKQSAV